ncbi:PREDICTED: ATPase family AAA domain-containing protein 5 isoform X1 [Calidris pugnax]|uniref:ATPase family AAA domain-containing protein 5 isoform X1 n=1 Tax=Calidris pugnax TaxID=198806 RepID=UPI00071D3D9C|nr:PREDICTED: ATPase family AAA domain-containing protein 5 isoform X1 [Calidris pugnax]
MVGRVAVAAAAASLPAKDGEAQPCKKRREEDTSVKTITKYFSPLAKPADKVLSPPKANNILDYFKKTSVTEKAMLPVVAGEDKTPLDADDKDCKPPFKPSLKRKRKGKRVNLNNKMREMKEPENEHEIEVSGDDSRETTGLKQDGNDVIATCTSVDPKCARELAEDNVQGENTSDAVLYRKNVKKIGSEINGTKNRIRKSRKRKHKVNMDSSESFSSENQLNEKCEKETEDKKKMVSPTTAECGATISDPSSEVHGDDKTSQANDSIITVSFEDFLKSQGENNIDHVEEETKPTAVNSATANEADKSDSVSDPEKCEESQQLPLRTVTVLAQVHSIPPKLAPLHKEQKSSRKIASIFLRQKGCVVEKESSPPLLDSEQTEQVTQKRKSNVVIEEEELELAVLETAGSDSLKPKCTVEERHQFMKAFRQPASDVIKSGVKKAPGKQKQAVGKSSKEKEGPEDDTASNKGLESEVPEDYVDKYTHSGPENSRTKTKRPKKFQKKGKRRRKASGTKETNVSNTSNEDPGASVLSKENSLNVKIPSSPKVNELRRSLRQRKIKPSKNVTPKKPRRRSTFSEDELSGSPFQTSTPKTSRQSLKKSNMYKAEVITVPLDGNSPIRMRFTRINATTKSNKAEAMKNEELTSKNTKISSTSKNMSKAKQLIEKAKAIRHNRSKVNEDSPAPVRRSSRQQALAEKKKIPESEESVIILDSSLSDSTPTVQNVKQKKLRSLNDVLGKKSGNLKTAKKRSNGKLGYPSSCLRRNPQNSAGEPIVIFDESSQDASENSQDDDQFRAKREFLMSGLPELLKRQIAKKAAAMEAYSLASSCFKTVVHVQQKDDCYPMWKLKSPSCPLLTKLRKLNTKVTNVAKITLSLGEFSTVNSKLTGNCSAPVLSGHRPVFPDTFRKDLLDEIVSSNSQFPVRKYFYKFLKKQTERSSFENVIQESRNGTANSEVNQKHSDNWKETKRKRKETEEHKSKRRKQIDGTETEIKSRVSRNLISPISGENQAETGQATHLEKNKTQKPDVMTEDTENLSEPNALSGVEKEDMLWTEKYQPQDSSELVGNKKEIERLHSWLKEWKKRADLEEKRNQKAEKEDKEHEDSSDSFDFKDNKSDLEEETSLCNTVLITGPPGVGKTAAVYACAQELGFKIFEVNASCQRSGRQILSQLKEATQSHQVDKKGVNAHKPCFFNSCSSAKSPKKMYSPKKVISPRKPPLSPKGAGLKRGLPPKTLANYFKISSKRKSNDGAVTSQEKNKGSTQNSCEEKKDAQVKSINKEVEEGEPNRKSATSLILFEEVDIIFDEDAGFLSAIKTFMATAKRPVILTTNDPTFSLMFDGYFEEINFRTPSLINAASYLQVLCLAENLRTDVKDLATLLTTNNCDIRQSVLYLQFWVRSGGGCLKDKCLAHHGGDETNKADDIIHSEKTTDSKSDLSQADAHHLQEFPKCDTGCVETLLGLKNILLPSEDLFTFLKHKNTTVEKWNKLNQLLTEFQMKKVDFIYSNLELILPLPVQVLSNESEASNSILERTTTVSSKNRSTNNYCSGKKSKKTKNQKRLNILDDSDLFDTGLSYSAEFITLPSDSPTSCADMNEDEPKLLMNKEEKEIKTSANKKNSALVFQCLNSLTEFVDNMSFLDCCVNTNTKEPLEFSKEEGFNWTNGKIRNGLCDEFRIENTDWWSSQSCSEIKAAIEALSFNKCSVSITQHLESSSSASRTPESDQQEGLTLHISNTRNCVSFSQSADSRIHKKAQKRLAVIRTVFSRSPSNLGNKQASVLEYLPTLRSICRSQKLKEQGKTKRRFLHYLEGIHLEIPMQMMNSMSLDFP